MLAATQLAAHHGDVVLPDPVCTLLYVVAIIATIIAFVALLASLFGGWGGRTRTGWAASPFLANWLYPAGVALVAWLIYVFLC